MNFNPSPGSPGGRPWSKERMAKWEINYRFGFIDALWWRWMPGTVITVKWPVGPTKPWPAPGGGFIQMESADPNDHFRPWLEQHVGHQGWDWNWRIGSTASSNDDGTVIGLDTLVIKFRRGREKCATMFALEYT